MRLHVELQVADLEVRHALDLLLDRVDGGLELLGQDGFTGYVLNQLHQVHHEDLLTIQRHQVRYMLLGGLQERVARIN